MNIENKNIILTTLNSRFSHSSLSLRYLFANLKELKDEAKILEFVINSQNQTIVEEILEYKIYKTNKPKYNSSSWRSRD